MTAIITRYRDALMDPAIRLIGTHKGVEWVSDRYVMVRTDMWKRTVTPRGAGYLTHTLSDSVVRKTLSGIPRDFPSGHRLTDLTLRQNYGRTVGFVSSGTAITPFDNQVRPLLEACDHVTVHANGSRIAGFQRRPRSAKPVLVCVVMGIRFIGGEFVEVDA